MKKMLIAMLLLAAIFGTTGCGVTLGDTSSTTNTNSNNDNSVNYGSSDSSEDDSGRLSATINDNKLICTQNLNSTEINEGSYNMQKLEYGSVVLVVEQVSTISNITVEFALADNDHGKELSCGSEFVLSTGTHRTYRSNTITYQ